MKNIQTNTKNINQEMIQDFERIFNEWSEKIEAALEETESERTRKPALAMRSSTGARGCES